MSEVCQSHFKELHCVLPIGHSGRHCDRMDVSTICWDDPTHLYGQSELDAAVAAARAEERALGPCGHPKACLVTVVATFQDGHVDEKPVCKWCAEIEGSEEELTELRASQVRMKEALQASVLALDDWLNIHASDHCEEARVEQARQRICEKGTIAYIADVQAINRAALLAQYGEKE